MKETPLLLCGEMVRATLEDRKTQTRRVMKLQPIGNKFEPSVLESLGDEKTKLPVLLITPTCYEHLGVILNRCPYGQAGDRLYFKETHYRWGRWRKGGLTKTGRQRWRFKAVPWKGESNGIRFCVNETRAFEPAKKRNKLGWHKRPSIFMPRLGARLRATITDVRVERVQSITEDDAEAEGVEEWKGQPQIECDGQVHHYPDASFVRSYKELWDTLNANRGFGWDKNPWVWVLEFKRIAP